MDWFVFAVLFSFCFMLYNGVLYAVFNIFYGKILAIARELDLDVLLKKLEDRIRGLVYRDLLYIISKDVENIMNKYRRTGDIKVLLTEIGKIERGERKPSQEFYDAIEDYHINLKSLTIIRHVYEYAIDREWKIRKIISPMSIFIVAIIVGYSLQFMDEPASAILASSILLLFTAVILEYPSDPIYKQYQHIVLRVLSEIMRIRKIEKRDNYEEYINIVRREWGV